jgi:hypothetical protein
MNAAEQGFRKPYVQQHVRMNDYVGAGIFATLIWHEGCPEGGHLIGLLTHTCVLCGAEPSIEWEDKKKN